LLPIFIARQPSLIVSGQSRERAALDSRDFEIYGLVRDEDKAASATREGEISAKVFKSVSVLVDTKGPSSAKLN
jgi:hypothetical protein